MAWALEFDGNGYAPFNSDLTLLAASDWQIEIKFKLDEDVIAGGNDIFALFRGNTSNYMYYRLSNQFFLGRIGGKQIQKTTPKEGVIGAWLTMNIYNDSTANLVWFDVPELGITSNMLSPADGFFSSFSRSGSWEFEGQIEYAKYYSDLTQSTLVNHWDATNSSHAAGVAVLTDTVSGNDATAVGLPTDGSAWVDLGGGGTSGTITQTAESFTQAATATVQNNLSGTISQNTSSFIQVASGAVTSSSTVGFIAQITSSFTQSLTGDITESYNGSISQAAQAFTQSALGVVASSVIGSIYQQTQAFTQSGDGFIITPIDGTINQQAASFTMSATAKIPVEWQDKPKATTNWQDKTKVTTIWS